MPLRAGREEAAAAIWDWPEPVSARATSHGRERFLGSLQAAATGALATLLFLYWSRTVGSMVLGFACILLFSALVSPGGLYLAIRRGLAALGRVTGSAVTWVLMVPVFYGFFLPFGLLLRRGRRDRLKRYLEPERPTYWEKLEGATAASQSRERQY